MFDGLYVISPGSGLSCPRCRAGLTADVAPGSRRQNHTISPYAANVRPEPKLRRRKRPSQPAPRQRDEMRKTSLWRHGLRPNILLICVNVKRIFGIFVGWVERSETHRF